MSTTIKIILLAVTLVIVIAYFRLNREPQFIEHSEITLQTLQP